VNAMTLSSPEAIVHRACLPHTWSFNHGRASRMIAIGRLTNASMLPNRWMLPLTSLVPIAQLVLGNTTTSSSPSDQRLSAIEPPDRHLVSPLWTSAVRMPIDPAASSSTATSKTGR